MTKYDKLRLYLRSRDSNEVVLTYSQINEILGESNTLARWVSQQPYAFWINNIETRPHARTWVEEGWSGKYLGDNKVQFTRKITDEQPFEKVSILIDPLISLNENEFIAAKNLSQRLSPGFDISIIPGLDKIECTRLLIAFCELDTFHERALQAISHAIKCRDTLRKLEGVMFVPINWSNKRETELMELSQIFHSIGVKTLCVKFPKKTSLRYY